LLLAPVSAVPQSPQAPSASGLILGRVVEAVTNAPVRDAIVQLVADAGEDVDMVHLSPDGDNQPLGVLTDSDGQFLFTGLAAGSYRLGARRQGYHVGMFGGRRPNDLGEPLALRNGERRGDIVIRIWKYAAITGVVTDQFGDPIVHAPVRAYQRTLVAGHSRLGMGAAYATTDDRGVYRLSRLMPGEYIVGVVRSDRSAPAALIEEQRRLMAAANRAEAGAIGEALGNAGAYVAPPGTPDSMRVGAAFVGLSAPIAPAAADAWTIYATQFYPDVPAPSAARIISVRSGEETAGIDFRLRAERTRVVTGTLTDTDGPVARFPVRLLPAIVSDFQAEALAPGHVTVTDDEGRFVFPAVPAGNYVVRALRGTGGSAERWAAAGAVAAGGGVMISSGDFGLVTAEMPPAPKPELTRYGTLAVTVGDRDVSNVALSLARGTPLRGTVEFVGRQDRADPAELQTIGIVVEAVDGRVAGFDFETNGQVDREGKFETAGLPAGRYFVRVPALPPGWTLDSVRFAGRDVSDEPLDVGTAPIGDLTIRLTQQPSVFTGSVRVSAPQDDLSRSMVVIFPADRTRWRDYGTTPRRLRHAGLAPDGSFEIRGLPPGEYLSAAIADDFVRDWRALSLLEVLAQTATRVTIGAGRRSSHSLAITPIPSGGR
jgi:protocatechuate 3,4-dioxygenase beta subunit